MHGPPLAGWLMVAVCASISGYCLLRMAGAVPAERAAAGRDALMGVGMAVMALPVGGHGGWSAGACAAVFGAAAVRALLPLRRAVADPHHAVGTLAMAYAAVAMLSGEHGAAALPVVTGALLVYYAGYALLSGVGLVVSGGAASGGCAAAANRDWRRLPELVAGCRLCMAIGMLVMLLAL